MGTTSDPEAFRLDAMPATPRGRLEQAIRSKHEERDSRARREPCYQEIRNRAYIGMSAEELLGVFDPVEDGATLDRVVARLCQHWPRDFTVWKAGRLVAMARMGRRRHAVTVLDE